MSEAGLRVLILGGYGVFGGRLAQLLADEPRLTIIIAGRSKTKAAEFCRRLTAKATLVPARFDRDGDVAEQVRAIGADVLVDATGPFQLYGAEPYRVVKAALALGIDYLDLADGSEFVEGIAQFDQEARSRGVTVLAGVSSFPVLTAAVVRHLTLREATPPRGAGRLARLHSITAGIAPSPYAGVGLNVIRAIASYAGKPVKLTRGGGTATGYGLTETMRYTVAPPGRLPLHNKRFSLVDVPDLQILPKLWPGLDAIWMGAGPVPEILHRALNLLAGLVRLRVLPSLTPLAPLFHYAINLIRWGEHRGGMFVAVEGVSADGLKVRRSWHLLAEGDDGPLIPSMACEALIRHRLAGRRVAPGARAATSELELADYEQLFERRTILTGTREDGAATNDWPLYRRVLADAWLQLPAPIRQLHEIEGVHRFAGFAKIERSSNPVARLICGVFGFPASGDDVSLEVTLSRVGNGELWRRNFAGQVFESHQAEGSGRFDKLIVERFGPFRFGLALVPERDKLKLVPRRWSFLGLPLPLALVPKGNSFETVEDGRFKFHVEIGLPLVGLLVRYQGTLQDTAKLPTHRDNSQQVPP